LPLADKLPPKTAIWTKFLGFQYSPLSLIRSKSDTQRGLPVHSYTKVSAYSICDVAPYKDKITGCRIQL